MYVARSAASGATESDLTGPVSCQAGLKTKWMSGYCSMTASAMYPPTKNTSGDSSTENAARSQSSTRLWQSTGTIAEGSEPRAPLPAPRITTRCAGMDALGAQNRRRNGPRGRRELSLTGDRSRTVVDASVHRRRTATALQQPLPPSPMAI